MKGMLLLLLVSCTRSWRLQGQEVLEREEYNHMQWKVKRTKKQDQWRVLDTEGGDKMNIGLRWKTNKVCGWGVACRR